MTSVEPFGPLKKLQLSLAPPKTCIDLENDMLYWPMQAWPGGGGSSSTRPRAR